MGADAPTIVFIPVHCAPKKAPCPKCGKLGKRKRTCTREVRTVAFKAVAYLKITYGEYTAQCKCCTTFRNTPEGVLPKAHYDNKVRDLVLDRIIKDGMSIERILASLRREFSLELSSGFVYNVLRDRAEELDMSEHRRKVLAITGDTTWCDSIPAMSQAANLLVSECTDFNLRTPVHLSYTQLREHRAEIDANRIVLTHVGADLLKNRAKVRHHIARDGERFDI